MKRREFLARGGAGLLASLAGDVDRPAAAGLAMAAGADG